MPTYDYRCPEGHDFELFQKMSDEPRASCPTCGAEAVRLLSGGAGFLFKGDGFYITDYRSDEYRKAASAEEKAAPGAASEKAASGAASKEADSGTASKKAASGAPLKKATSGTNEQSGKKPSKDRAASSAPATSGGGS